MNKFIKVCALIFAFALLFSIAGCKSCKKPAGDPVIESIDVVESTIPSIIDTNEIASK